MPPVCQIFARRAAGTNQLLPIRACSPIRSLPRWETCSPRRPGSRFATRSAWETSSHCSGWRYSFTASVTAGWRCLRADEWSLRRSVQIVFETVLVAGRGEIARRDNPDTAPARGAVGGGVQRGRRRTPLTSVKRTRRSCSARPIPSQSYLDAARLIEAARRTGAQAVCTRATASCPSRQTSPSRCRKPAWSGSDRRPLPCAGWLTRLHCPADDDRGRCARRRWFGRCR